MSFRPHLTGFWDGAVHFYPRFFFKSIRYGDKSGQWIYEVLRVAKLDEKIVGAALDCLVWGGIISVYSTVTGKTLIGMWNIQSCATMSVTDEEIMEVDIKMDDN